jgi:hypothetical protein
LMSISCGQELEGSTKSEKLEGTKHFLLDHKEVLDRFGRYPHRNGKLGRETTPEELRSKRGWMSRILCQDGLKVKDSREGTKSIPTGRTRKNK